jgi:hypothetical protein
MTTFTHREHTDTCMSAHAEQMNRVVKMTPVTIEANHYLHMQDVWYEIGKDNRRKRPTALPMNRGEWCAFLGGLDIKHNTPKENINSHHHTCPVHGRKHYPNRDDYNAMLFNKAYAE